MLIRPVEDFGEFFPVVHILEGHLLHRGTRHDQAIVVVGLQGIERLIELHEMVARMRCLMARNAHEVKAHLEGRLRDEAQDLRLGLDLCRHEVQEDDTKRADLLSGCHFLFEGEDVLVVQDLLCGQAVRDIDRHEGSPESLSKGWICAGAKAPKRLRAPAFDRRASSESFPLRASLLEYICVYATSVTRIEGEDCVEEWQTHAIATAPLPLAASSG